MAPALDVLLSFRKTPSSRVHESLRQVKMSLRLAALTCMFMLACVSSQLQHRVATAAGVGTDQSGLEFETIDV